MLPSLSEAGGVSNLGRMGSSEEDSRNEFEGLQKASYISPSFIASCPHGMRSSSLCVRQGVPDTDPG